MQPQDRQQMLDRQQIIIHPDLQGATIVVAGAGMVGGWVTLALARTGATVYVYDPDNVVAANVGCQPYGMDDVGQPKVARLAMQLNGLPIFAVPHRFPLVRTAGGHGIPSLSRAELREQGIRHCIEPPELPAVVVSCVDSMSGRRAIAEWCREQSIRLFLDTRAQGELTVLVAVGDPRLQSYATYLSELQSDDEVVEAPCGARGTAYTGMWLASRVVATINNWYRGLTIPASVFWHVGGNLSAGGDQQAVHSDAGLPVEEHCSSPQEGGGPAWPLRGASQSQEE